jgi:hypothetical protein
MDSPARSSPIAPIVTLARSARIALRDIGNAPAAALQQQADQQMDS